MSFLPGTSWSFTPVGLHAKSVDRFDGVFDLAFHLLPVDRGNLPLSPGRAVLAWLDVFCVLPAD